MGLENNTNIARGNSGQSQKSLSSRSMLIKPGETLIKKEDSSVVVRTTEGKLVRRTDSDGEIASVYKLIKLNEVLVSIDGDSVVVRNESGKLVKRKTATASILKEASEPKKETVAPVQKEAVKPEAKKEVEQKEESKPENKEGLRDRLLSKHSFLDRINKGESVSAPKQVVVEAAPLQANDDIEEIEDIEDVQADSSVTQLEAAVTKEKFDRSIGRGSSKAAVGSGARGITQSALNPNEKPLQGVNGKLNQSLAGNVQPEIVLAKPDVEIKKKVKKQRKPIKAWMVMAALVGIYTIGMMAYFFTAYNFEPKKVDVNLYYISIGSGAKLDYYDGEKINTTDMLMTFYYSKSDIQTANLVESNLAESTVGMGYAVNNKGYITALWQDGYESADSRSVKLKFTYEGLISYVPVTIYRNKLTELKKQFIVPTLYAGLELSPTIYGVYTNEVLESQNNSIQRELDKTSYDLVLEYGSEEYSLKELGAFSQGKYTLPEIIEGQTIDYSRSGTKLYAVYHNDGYNTEKRIELF